MRLSEVTPARVDRFAGQASVDRLLDGEAVRSVASGVCGLAVRRAALRSNPLRDVSTLEKRGEHEARALTPEECREWLAILDSSELARRKDLRT